MTSSRRPALALAAGVTALIVLGGTAVMLQVIRERRLPPPEPVEQVLYVRSPAVITRLALSFDALVADIYWMRTLQYYGGMRLSDAPVKRYELLYPLLDVTTALDPAFSIAYRFGAFFLSEPAPGGAARPDLAVRLLEKAMRANPQRWEYPHDIAFVHYRQGDYRRAAEWFLRAAEVPDSADWLRPLAAIMLARGGDRTTARQMWQRLGASEEPWLQQAAEHRLRQLDAMEQIDQLQRLTRFYEQQTGGPPQRWDDLMRVGLIRGVPLDPAGVPYELNPWWGDVTVSRESPLWPLPADAPEP